MSAVIIKIAIKEDAPILFSMLQQMASDLGKDN